MASENGTGRNGRDVPSDMNDRARSSSSNRRPYPDNSARPGAMRPASTDYSRNSASRYSRSSQTPRASRGMQTPRSSRNAQSPQTVNPIEYHGSAAQRYSRDSGAYVATVKPRSKKRVVFVVILIVLLVAAIAGVAFFIYKETRKAEINDDLHKMDEAQLEALDSVLTGTQTVDEPFVVLLLGTDSSAEREESEEYGGGGFRTDTNILARIDPVNNTVSLISIQRDTLIDLPDVGVTKFNAAYTYGGPSGTIEAVKQLTGVDVDHYAEIDFDGMVSLIDAVGGIDVYVPEAIDDYDAGGSVEEGMQHLDGEHALVFARSRAYADGDYTRATNQRIILEALVHKLLETPASELAGIIQASTEFLTTDSGLDFDFIYSVADQMRHNPDRPTVEVYSANLPSVATMIGDVSYVVLDTAGTADMIAAFLAGEDIGQVEVSSSIDQDIANAEALVGYSGYGYNYGYGYDYGYSGTTDTTYGYGYTDTGTGYDYGYGYTTDTGTGYGYGYADAA